MNVSTHEAHRAWDELKWLMLMALATLLVVAFASHTAGFTETPERPAKVYVISHWNGIFRASELPGGPPFVEVGIRVEPGTVVGLIEEVMVDRPPRTVAVPAGVSGIVSDVLISDGQMVVVGQPLFEIQPDDEFAMRR